MHWSFRICEICVENFKQMVWSNHKDKMLNTSLRLDGDLQSASQEKTSMKFTWSLCSHRYSSRNSLEPTDLKSNVTLHSDTLSSWASGLIFLRNIIFHFWQVIKKECGTKMLKRDIHNNSHYVDIIRILTGFPVQM